MSEPRQIRHVFGLELAASALGIVGVVLLVARVSTWIGVGLIAAALALTIAQAVVGRNAPPSP